MIEMKKYIVSGLIMAYAACFYALAELPDSKFHIYFLNVDQGDSIFIKTPEDNHILVDGGPANYVLSELSEVIPFFDRKIDLMVLTHPHLDHIEGLIEVLKRYEVSHVLITGVSFNDATYKEFLKQVRELGVPVYIAESDTDFRFGEVLADVIYPLTSVAGETFANLNNSSIGLRISYGDKAIVMLGDLEVDAEKILLQSGHNLKADIFKASHHGSRTASSPALLEKIKPTDVVIQVGKNNSFKHPHPETLRNLFQANVKNIFRTDEDGRVEFTF